VDDLRELLAEHRAATFPATITKGLDYGEIDAVMIGADIFGWAMQALDGRLATADRDRLEVAHDQLARSLEDLPVDARPYYERLLALAAAALR
jgi:hypothetical protein